MFLIIDNTKNISKAYMTPRLIKTLEKFHIKYKILSERTDVNKLIENIEERKKIKGIILSGGPLCLSDEINMSLINKNIAIFVTFPNIPILGICFGFQIMSAIYGGKIVSMRNKKEGVSYIKIIDKSDILNNRENKQIVYNSHKDQLIEKPPLFNITAYDIKDKVIQCIESKKLKRYGVQFHPEALKITEYIIKNFINICLDI